MSNENSLRGELLGDAPELSLEELCRSCAVELEHAMTLISEGVIEPYGSRVEDWRFTAISIRRVRIARRLQRDLGVNPAGAALALDLLERIADLEQRLR